MNSKLEKGSLLKSGSLTTEEKILSAYLEISYRQGSAEPTLMKIADYAQVAYGTVRYYFNAKNLDISESAISYVARTGQAFVTAYLADLKRDRSLLGVQHWVCANLEWARQYPAHASYWIYFYYASSTKGHLAKKGMSIIQVAENRIKELLYLDIGKGLLPPLKEFDELAMTIHSQTVGAMVRSVVIRDPVQYDKIVTSTQQILMKMIMSYTIA